MSHADAIDQEPWIALFDQERNDRGESTDEDALGNIVKDFLLSDDKDAAAASNTAQRIQNYYDQEYFVADPLLKFQDDQGMGEFLAAFYNIILLLARLIPYNSLAQQRLLLLLLELRKLPPKSVTIWEEECLVWTREPVSAVLIDEDWNGYCPGDTHPQYSSQRNYDEWLNFSCFLARYIEAGCMDRYENRFKYPNYDISHGLDDNLPPGPERDCKVMVAAQYILLVGRSLAKHFFRQDPEKTSLGPKAWRRWAKKLEEISQNEKKRSGDDDTEERKRKVALASAVEEAYQYMMALDPDARKAS